MKLRELLLSLMQEVCAVVASSSMVGETGNKDLFWCFVSMILVSGLPVWGLSRPLSSFSSLRIIVLPY